MSQEVIEIIRHEFHNAKTLGELSNRLFSLLTAYETLASTHITWFTHKNPYGCWICDLLLDLRTFGVHLDRLIQSDADETDRPGDSGSLDIVKSP